MCSTGLKNLEIWYIHNEKSNFRQLTFRRIIWALSIGRFSFLLRIAILDRGQKGKGKGFLGVGQNLTKLWVLNISSICGPPNLSDIRPKPFQTPPKNGFDFLLTECGKDGRRAWKIFSAFSTCAQI